MLGRELRFGALHHCSPRTGMLGFCTSLCCLYMLLQYLLMLCCPSSISSHPLPLLPIMFFTWTPCPASSLASLPFHFSSPEERQSYCESDWKSPYCSSQDGGRWQIQKGRNFNYFHSCILEQRQGCWDGRTEVGMARWLDWHVKSDTFVLRLKSKN